MDKTSNRVKTTPQYLLDLKEAADKERASTAAPSSLSKPMPPSNPPSVDSIRTPRKEGSPYALAVLKYKEIVDLQKAHKLQPLTLGNEPQTVFGTIARWEFVLESFRLLESQPNHTELKEKFLIEVRKREMAPWWQGERGRFGRHFAHVLTAQLMASAQGVQQR